jgi:hypothetical protein
MRKIHIDRRQEGIGLIYAQYATLPDVYKIMIIQQFPGAKEWRVNWAALGNVRADEAKLYADLLKAAAKIAEELTAGKEVK